MWDWLRPHAGRLDSDRLGTTLIHEHIFIHNPELEMNLPDGEWDPPAAIETAVEGLTTLYRDGVGTVVDLTVPGLGRDVRLVARVAERVPRSISSPPPAGTPQTCCPRTSGTTVPGGRSTTQTDSWNSSSVTSATVSLVATCEPACSRWWPMKRASRPTSPESSQQQLSPTRRPA